MLFRSSLTSDQTLALPDRSYWDIQGTLIDDTTQVKTYMRGALIVTTQAAE